MRSLTITAAVLACLSIGAPAWAGAGPVSAARHDGVVAGDSVRWRAEYELRPGAPDMLDLAFPLPKGTLFDASPTAAPVERAGRIVALHVLAEGLALGRVTVTLTEPLDRRGSAGRLSPPLAEGFEVQLVDVSGADDLRFEPDPRTGLERHVGFFAPVELPPSARVACDRAVGYVRVRALDDPMYVQAGAAVVADEGLRGTLSTGAERARSGVLAAGGIFLGLVLGLVLLQRKLSRAARLESAERTLAAAFERLDDG